MKENKRDINKDKPTDEESDEALVRYKKSRQYENIANENRSECKVNQHHDKGVSF